MTYQGAINELKSLENNGSMPDWFKPALKKVRETMEMDRIQLDDVKAEIDKLHKVGNGNDGRVYVPINDVFDVIDKHISEKETK